MSFRKYSYNKDELMFMNQNFTSTGSVLCDNFTYLGADPYLKNLLIPDCIKKGSHMYASKSTIKQNLHQSKGEHRNNHHYHHAAHPNTGGSGDGPHYGPSQHNPYAPPNSGLGSVYNGRSDKYYGQSHHHYSQHHPKHHNPGVWYHGAEHQHQAPPYTRQSSHHEDSGNISTGDTPSTYVNFGSGERRIGGAAYGGVITPQPRRRIYSESNQRDPSAGRDQAKNFPYHNNHNHGVFKAGTPKSPQIQQAQVYRPGPLEINNASPVSFFGGNQVSFSASKSVNESGGGLDFGLGPSPPSFISSLRPDFYFQGQSNVDIIQTTTPATLGSAEQRPNASPSNLARKRNLTYTSSGKEGTAAKGGATPTQETLKPPLYHTPNILGVGMGGGNSFSVVNAANLSSPITHSPLPTHYYTPLTSPRWDSLHQTPHNFTNHPNNPQSLLLAKELKTVSTATTTTTADIEAQLGFYLEAMSSINRTQKGYRLTATPPANSKQPTSTLLLKSEILFLYLSGLLKPWDSLSHQDTSGSPNSEITVQDLLLPHHGIPALTQNNPIEGLRAFRGQLSSLETELNALLGVDKVTAFPLCSPEISVMTFGSTDTQNDVPKASLGAGDSEQKESKSKKKGKNKKNKGNENSAGEASQLPLLAKQPDVAQKPKLPPVVPLNVPEVESLVSPAVKDGDKVAQKSGKKKKQNKKGETSSVIKSAVVKEGALNETGTNPSSPNSEGSKQPADHNNRAATLSQASASPTQQMKFHGPNHENEMPVMTHPNYETLKQKSQDILTSLLTTIPRLPSDFDGQNNDASGSKSAQNHNVAGKAFVPNKDKVKDLEPTPQIKSANTGEWQKIESRGKKSKKNTSNTGTK